MGILKDFIMPEEDEEDEEEVEVPSTDIEPITKKFSKYCVVWAL